MKATRTIPLTLILSGIAFGVAWLFLPFMVERSAVHILEREGLQNVEVQVQRVGYSSTTVDELRFEYANVVVHLTAARLEYHWPGLLRGKLQLVDIPNIVIRVKQESSGNDEVSLPGIDLPDGSVIQATFDWLPAEGIEIRQLDLGRDIDGGVTSFGISIDRHSGGASVDIRLGIEQPLPDGLLVNIGADAALDGLLYSSGGPENVIMTFSWLPLDAEDAIGSISARGELSDILSWARPFLAGLQDESSCGFELNARVWRNPVDGLFVTSSLSNCDFDLLRFNQAQVQGRFTRSPTGFESVAPVKGVFKDLDLPGVAAASAEIQAGVRLDSVMSSVSVKPDAWLRLSDVRSSDLKAKMVELHTTHPMIFSHDSTPEGYAASLFTSEIQGVGFQIVPLEMVLELDKNLSTVNVYSDGLKVMKENVKLDFSEANVQLNINDTGVTGELDGRMAGKVPVHGRFEADFSTGSGAVSVESETFTLGAELERASELISGWPKGVELVSGTLTLASETLWDAEQFDSRLDVSLEQAGGEFEGVFFSNGAAKVALDLLPHIETRSPVRISVDAIDFGFVLENAIGDIHFEIDGTGSPRLEMAGFSAGFFDGTIGVPKIELGGLGGSYEFEIHFEGLDLQCMAGGQQCSGLAIDGRISGRLPVILEDSELRIENGALTNDGVGRINYDAGADTATGGAEILFKALKEFEYDVLTAEPLYRSDGTLLLNLHLEGISQEIGENQPIHFNINLEQNVLSLLESIRLVNGLNDRIDRKVQKFYEDRSSKN